MAYQNPIKRPAPRAMDLALKNEKLTLNPAWSRDDNRKIYDFWWFCMVETRHGGHVMPVMTPSGELQLWLDYSHGVSRFHKEFVHGNKYIPATFRQEFMAVDVMSWLDLEDKSITALAVWDTRPEDILHYWTDTHRDSQYLWPEILWTHNRFDGFGATRDNIVGPDGGEPEPVPMGA